MAKHNRKSRRTSSLESLEARRLMSSSTPAASLSVGSSLMVFNAVHNSAASQVETLTLTDTGSDTLTLGSIGLANDPTTAAAASQFSIVNASSEPTSLAPGQSFGLELQYTANTVGTQSALLEIASNDPVNPAQTVTLHGIGTQGLGGSNQPSLATILQAYDIPTYVGEGYDDDNATTDSVYPETPDPSSQEVTMPRLEKAGTGPVTIQVLASFTSTGYTEGYTLGTYVPGQINNRTELFYTPGTEAQSTYVQPQGSTSFDPGSSQFGFYFVSNLQTNGADRIGYSEDSLNTWDTTVDRKFRFFPLETANGTVVPNAYILTSTDYNAPAGYDFTNMVAIVRNVQPAPAEPVLGLNNTDVVSGNNRLVFSKINAVDPNHPTYVNNTHTTAVLTLDNTGSSPLTVTSYAVSGPFSLVNAPSFPLTIAVGATVNLTVSYNAETEPTIPYNETETPNYPQAGGVWSGSLVLNSNDPVNPASTIALQGWRQYHPENDNEPSLQTITNLVFGYDTVINSTPVPTLDEDGSVPVYYGSEVASTYWNAADTSRPVTIQTIADYHTQNSSQGVSWYAEGSSTKHLLYTVGPTQAQTIMPGTTSNTSAPAIGSFTTSSAFGIDMDGMYSYDGSNTANGNPGGGHVARFYPLVNSSGQVVPDSYIVAWDYNIVPGQNFDFNDCVMIVTNIRPTLSPPTPTDVTSYATSTGNVLQWAPANYTNLGGYLVYSASSASGPFTQLTPSPITSTTFTDTSASASASTYYQITAIGGTTNTQSVAATAAVLVAGGTSPVVAAGDPVAAPETVNTLAGNPVTIHVQADSTDSTATLSPATIKVNGNPSHGTVSISTTLGTITYTPAAGYSGSDSFMYQIGDSTGAISSPATVSVTVAKVVVGSPVAANLTGVTVATSPLTLATIPKASDSTATLNASSVTITTAPADGTATVNVATGAITYTANAGFTGTDVFDYTISDSLGATTSPASVTITVDAATVIPVNPPNGPNSSNGSSVGHPVAAAVTLTTSSATAVTVNLVATATDTTGTINASSVAITTAPADGIASVSSNGVLTYTPNYGFVGTDTLQYTVGDSLGATSAPATVTIDVGEKLGGTAARTVTFVDKSGTRTVLALTGVGSGQVFFNGNGTFAYTGNPAKGNVLVTGPALSIASIALTGTSSTSSLTLTDKGSAAIPIGTISSSSSLRQIVAPNAVVTGGLTVGGSISTLTLGTLGDALTINGGATNLTFTTVTAGLDTTISGAVNTFTVKAGGFTGALTAASLNSGKITGSLANSALQFTAGGVARLSVSGAMTNSTITATGNLGTITAAGIGASTIAAGVVVTSGSLPTLASAFVSAATISSVVVTGRGTTFSDSVIAAQTVKSVSLGTVTTANNGTAFGIAAGTLGSASATFNTGGLLRAGKKQLATQADFTAYLASRDLSPADFEVLIGL